MCDRGRLLHNGVSIKELETLDVVVPIYRRVERLREPPRPPSRSRLRGCPL